MVTRTSSRRIHMVVCPHIKRLREDSNASQTHCRTSKAAKSLLHLILRPTHQSSVAQTMAGKQSSPLFLHSSSYLTVLVLSCLLAASSSASLAQRRPMQLEVDDIGVYFKWIVEVANPEPSTLSVEVSTTMHNNTLALPHSE